MGFWAYLLLVHYLWNTGSPQAHDTGKLQTAKYSVRHIGNRSQVRGKIINKLFKPFARNPGSGLCRPITAQHLSYRGNTWTTSEWFGQLKEERFLVVQMGPCRTASNETAHNLTILCRTNKGVLGDLYLFQWRPSGSLFLLRPQCFFSAKFNRRLRGWQGSTPVSPSAE